MATRTSIRPLTGEDIAEVAYFAASAPEYMQIAEVLVMPTNQATGTIAYKKWFELVAFLGGKLILGIFSYSL